MVAAPAVVPDLEPPLPRDGLDEAGEAFFHRLAAGSVEDNIASTRDDFRSYVEHVDPGDGDDAALLARVEAGLHPADAAALATVDDALRAAAVREALAQPDGYLRDAAVAFRRWPFRVEDVRCPTWLWYGALDPQAAVRNGVWLADRIPDATFVVREEEAHLSPLLGHWPEILTTLARAAGA